MPPDAGPGSSGPERRIVLDLGAGASLRLEGLGLRQLSEVRRAWSRFPEISASPLDGPVLTWPARDDETSSPHWRAFHEDASQEAARAVIGAGRGTHLMLHAAAVSDGAGRALVLSAPSGTGKTTALEVLRGLGALCIDCDELYHELTRSSAELREALTARFGAVYTTGGELDRKALGRVVFADSAALGELNAIAHGFVSAELRRWLRGWAMQGGALAAIDAVALFESGADRLCTATFGVVAPHSERVRRIVAREGISAHRKQLTIKERGVSTFRAHLNGSTPRRSEAPLY